MGLPLYAIQETALQLSGAEHRIIDIGGGPERRRGRSLVAF